jgi:hypothetical protein
LTLKGQHRHTFKTRYSEIKTGSLFPPAKTA